MPPAEDSTQQQPENERLLLIVVGAHLRAELSDRPLAYRMRGRILQWIENRSAGVPETVTNDETIHALAPLVCSDLWYLNNDDLLTRPTISIGAPGVNAATAFLANRLPTAFAIENTLQVQCDVEMNQLHACLWGVNNSTTASAVDVFAERYLDRFLRRAHELPLDQ